MAVYPYHIVTSSGFGLMWGFLTDVFLATKMYVGIHGMGASKTTTDSEQTQKIKPQKVNYIGILVAVLAAGLLIGGTFFLASSSNSQPKNQSSQSQNTQQPKVASTQQIKTVEGGEYYFRPNLLTVKADEQISLRFRNVGTLPHNFVIPGLDLRTSVLNPGESETLSFQIPKATDTSELEFRAECTIPGHAEQGMVGTIRIES